MPGIPSTPNAVCTGAMEGSSLRRPVPSESAYVCHPAKLKTTSPTAKPSCSDAATSLTVPPTMTCPISTGFAYDLAVLIRPRM
jgi:hypothetical protein